MQDAAIETAKNGPPLTVAALTFMGVQLDVLIQLLTVLWLLWLLSSNVIRAFLGWSERRRVAKARDRARRVIARRKAIERRREWRDHQGEERQ